MEWLELRRLGKAVLIIAQYGFSAGRVALRRHAPFWLNSQGK